MMETDMVPKTSVGPVGLCILSGLNSITDFSPSFLVDICNLDIISEKL
jgi:hypothetical protein